MTAPFRFAALAAALLLAACASLPAAGPARDPQIDAAALLDDVRILASDEMEGRETGTPGAERARAYILERYREIGLAPVNGAYQHAFEYLHQIRTGPRTGVNVVGVIEGREPDGPVIVVSAHYDHLGMRSGGTIYNGADDNASGAAGMLAVAAWFAQNQPRHTLYFAAFDAEEVGLRGARAAIADGQLPMDRVAMNINLDMLGISYYGELVAAGAYHYPFLGEYIDEVAAIAPVTLIQGHDSPEYGPQGDWTMMSDHGPFHVAGVPFIYLGVDFHPHYHQPSDTYENLTHDFFAAAAQTALLTVLRFDEALPEIVAARAAAQAEAVK